MFSFQMARAVASNIEHTTYFLSVQEDLQDTIYYTCQNPESTSLKAAFPFLEVMGGTNYLAI